MWSSSRNKKYVNYFLNLPSAISLLDLSNKSKTFNKKELQLTTSILKTSYFIYYIDKGVVKSKQDPLEAFWKHVQLNKNEIETNELVT